MIEHSRRVLSFLEKAKGKRLFGDTSHSVNMELVRNDPNSKGVTITTYDHKG